MNPSVHMKKEEVGMPRNRRIDTKLMKAIFTLAVMLALAGGVSARTLRNDESAQINSDIAALSTAFKEGNAELIIDKTHSSLQELAGGREAFAELTRKALGELHATGIKVVRVDVGTSSSTYLADEEEVCFVPTATFMDLNGVKMKSVGFMVAIRRIGTQDWNYLDGSGFQGNPEMLFRLLPKLQRDVSLPPTSLEAL